jgi:IclR family transcriptional regulator, pca regulon regulatory protein
MSRRQADREFVEALSRGLAVIEVFDAAHSNLSLSEVARRAGLSPATARRSLHTLEALGYVRSINRRFMLSARILALGSAYLRAAHVDEVLMPELRRLVSLFGDAASVSVLDGHHILYLAHVSQQRAVRPIAGTGVTYPAYATSMGRVLLAGLRHAELVTYLAEARIEKLTERTETNRGRLREIVEAARRNGYATAVDQLAYGITALAVPVQVADGRSVAALNSSGYSGHIGEETLVRERLVELRLSASRIAAIITRYPALYHSLIVSGPSERGPGAGAEVRAMRSKGVSVDGGDADARTHARDDYGSRAGADERHRGSAP